MTDTDRELGLHEEDRLPWLEAVEDDDADEGMSTPRMIGFLAAALAAIALVVGGVMWLRSQKQGPSGDGTLIAAQEGDYKVKPDAPGGMKIDGQGDAAFAASEGAEANGKLNPAATPEAPIVAAKPGAAAVAAKPVASGKPAVTTSLAPAGGKLVAPVAPVAGSGTGGTLVQLGAYNTETSAASAWTSLTGRFPQLAKLTKTITPVAVNGSTRYRLRVNAGSAASAAALCGQVGNCMVVK